MYAYRTYCIFTVPGDPTLAPEYMYAYRTYCIFTVPGDPTLALE